MKLYALFVLTTACMAMITAQDKHCAGSKDGALCICSSRKIGKCTNEECQCETTSVHRRKRQFNCPYCPWWCFCEIGNCYC